MTVLIYIAGAIGMIVFMYWFVITLSRTAIRRTVEYRHRDSEVIVESGLVPPWWQRSLIVRLGSPRLAKRYALRRISRLVKYFKHTPLTDTEDTRAIVVGSLQDVRSQWRERSWEEIFPYE